MIELLTDQPLVSLPEYKVHRGGSFTPTELVEVHADNPDVAIGQFQAQFIATGEFA